MRPLRPRRNPWPPARPRGIMGPMDHLDRESILAVIESALAVIGAVGTLMTGLAPFFPQGSRVGKFLARYGADLKGHNK